MAPRLIKDCPEDIAPPQTDHVPLSITLQDSNFLANGHPFITHVPPNILMTSTKDLTAGCFVGFQTDDPSDRHVVPIGKLRNIKFMSLFRFKVWWTTHWTGNNGKDIQHETQMLLLDKSDLGRPYVVLLPLIERSFSASLQPGSGDDLEICVESGSTRVTSSTFCSCLYIHVGDDPYQLVNDAVNVIKTHLGTFKLLDEKTPPGIIDKFGWCTWDAFYLKVHPQGVLDGVKGLVDGGCPPGLVLIDDGWQSITQNNNNNTESDQEGMNYTVAGEQMPCRLLKFEENYKFRDYESKRVGNEKGLRAFVRDLKDEFKSVENVYVWHAMCGYWGGLRPKFPGLPDCRVVQAKLSKGLEMTMEDLAVDKILKNGVGILPPEKVQKMYEGLHAHLQAAGIDGVKVDVIQLIEMLGEEFGGRVDLAKAYYKALTASIRKHFKGNGVIASMEHCNDFMYLGTETIALGRVGDDFWLADPTGEDPNGTYWLQGCHMVHCAYNSLWMGNFIQPDWDMFQSTHPLAEFHAASRAISGGPIYVSDCVGQHNFDLLKTLVFPDGSVLRCQNYALPTRDSLFADPLHDAKTVLKIWNLNKFTGVLGAFNCQGGGWCPLTRRIKKAVQLGHDLNCLASPSDIEWINGKSSMSIKGVEIFAVYSYKQRNVKLLKVLENLEISLGAFDYDILTISPVRVLPRKDIQFAPIGLVNMLNTGGAIETLTFNDAESLVRIEVKGGGEMGVFASEKPISCKINNVGVDFGYFDHIVSVHVSWLDASQLSIIDYLF